ncbi:BrnA antitoxin family protein [Roseomonas stagni]|uniref:BrnA antitoxin family protein n=1 Tax=Falsiroseomonas algicola TaxID=2716930 RepID=A0A6M1LLL0_9PROT|nr:BrnA antitoxin family protein [Falsiroseomonas algicola]NGM21235.1 BrnA antitoxin family protein [Falsiroseomonas algicola]
MAEDDHIRRYSMLELHEKRARGESLTDDAHIRAMTEAELERSIADDPDWKDIPPNWHDNAVVVRQPPKKLISLRIDEDIVEWFRASGPGYQTWMNAVLRAYVTEQRKKQGPGKP